VAASFVFHVSDLMNGKTRLKSVPVKAARRLAAAAA
jgi:hypothetical protein